MKASTKAFILGMSSVFDMFPNTPKKPTSSTTDLQRLQSDWRNIGKNLTTAMERVEKNGRTKK